MFYEFVIINDNLIILELLHSVPMLLLKWMAHYAFNRGHPSKKFP